MRVAIVDDNEAWGFALACCLEKQGFEVATFLEPVQFIPLAQQFDLALIDFCMPAKRYQRDLDGTELICEIKQRFERPPLLVLMSAFFTADTLHTMKDICPSADAFLSKETDLSSILSKINHIIATRLNSKRPTGANDRSGLAVLTYEASSVGTSRS